MSTKHERGNEKLKEVDSGGAKDANCIYAWLVFHTGKYT